MTREEVIAIRRFLCGEKYSCSTGICEGIT